MPVNPDDIVTFIIQHKVRAAHREQYETWLRDVGREAERYPGHLGTNVIRPLDAHGQYTDHPLRFLRAPAGLGEV